MSFLNIPKKLDPHAYSTLDIKADMIEKEAKVVEAFARAMVKRPRSVKTVNTALQQ